MSDDKGVTEQPSYDLSNFKISEILLNNTRSKTITLLGIFPDLSDEDKAIVVLEKSAFGSDSTEDSVGGYFSQKTSYKAEFINNIYGNFEGLPPKEINKVKITVIYPATEKHIDKYSIRDKHLVLETPILYENVTEPYLKSTQFSLDWVYNILEHKKEKERIVFEDQDPQTGFILIPDLKWDGHSIETLYLLAIVHDRNIKSLRDLTDKHIPLLTNIRDEGLKAIENKYNIKQDQVRVYVHYQPSFYHFHVHFNPLNNDVPGMSCDKSHMLDTIINNITLMPDYYQKATLPFVLHDSALFEKFQEQEMRRVKPRLSCDSN